MNAITKRLRKKIARVDIILDLILLLWKKENVI